MRTRKPKRVAIERSSGNVFADLGLPQSAEMLARAELASRIAEIIAERRLTQAGAAKVLGIDQPSVSDLVRGRLRGFSSDRLFRFLNALGRDIEIVIRPRRRASARPAIRVVRRKIAG
jgi:predicted XRE-type DNA-binding protein